MKWFLLCVCTLSLSANAFFLWSERPEPLAKQSPALLSGVQKAPKLNAITVLPPELWTQIQDGDPRALAALRSAGFSEALVHAIVRAQIQVQFNEKEQALLPDPRSLKYWRKEQTAASAPSSRVAQLDLERDKAKLQERLLGSAEGEEERTSSDPHTSFLPPEKAKRVQTITDEYGAMLADVRGKDWNVLLPSEREKWAYLVKEKRTDLQQILTSDELAEYDLRNSSTANVLRSLLIAFNPTEEEFRSVFETLQEASPDIPDFFDLTGPPTAEAGAARAKAEAAADAELKTILGDQRYAEYKQAKDFEFQALSAIGKRLGLPAEKAIEAYALKQAFEKRVSETLANRSIGTDQSRNAALDALSTEEKAGLTKLLGPTGYEAFRPYGKALRDPLRATSPPSPVGPEP